MSIWNVDSLRELINERDRRYAVEKEAIQRALELAERNNAHWKAAADSVTAQMLERERNFASKGVGYVASALGILALVLTIADKFK